MGRRKPPPLPLQAGTGNHPRLRPAPPVCRRAGNRSMPKTGISARTPADVRWVFPNRPIGGSGGRPGAGGQGDGKKRERERERERERVRKGKQGRRPPSRRTTSAWREAAGVPSPVRLALPPPAGKLGLPGRVPAITAQRPPARRREGRGPLRRPANRRFGQGERPGTFSRRFREETPRNPGRRVPALRQTSLTLPGSPLGQNRTAYPTGRLHAAALRPRRPA